MMTFLSLSAWQKFSKMKTIREKTHTSLKQWYLQKR